MAELPATVTLNRYVRVVGHQTWSSQKIPRMGRCSFFLPTSANRALARDLSNRNCVSITDLLERLLVEVEAVAYKPGVGGAKPTLP